jgi:ATP-binding cassette subfamily A (ABC1) protein 3
MASGKFKCLGTVQELKSRYGQGFELVLRGRQVQPALITSLVSSWGLSEDAKLTKQECLQRITEFGTNAELDSSLAGFKLSRSSLFEKELNSDSISVVAFAEWWAQTNTTADILKFAAKELPGSVVLLENVSRVLKFAIRGERINMLDIFEVIENLKVAVGIEEYSINQYSLEQIFNDFAKQDTAAVAASLEN